MAVAPTGTNNYLQRQSSPSGLADVLNVILDKGLVIDIYLRVALVGIELLTVDARIVIASVDTYLRFAEAVNRMDLTQVGQQQTLPELVENLQESTAKKRTRGVLEGAKEKIFGDDEDEGQSEGGETRRARARSASGGASSGSSRASGSRSSGSRSSGSRSRSSSKS
ncbi:MAG: gvpA [Solirubrobacterales bacterium]|jgi:uncharacterized membrane protein YgcG|nr:gvpA [Solirubrobacterales bacterium]